MLNLIFDWSKLPQAKSAKDLRKQGSFHQQANHGNLSSTFKVEHCRWIGYKLLYALNLDKIGNKEFMIGRKIRVGSAASIMKGEFFARFTGYTPSQNPFFCSIQNDLNRSNVKHFSTFSKMVFLTQTGWLAAVCMTGTQWRSCRVGKLLF